MEQEAGGTRSRRRARPALDTDALRVPPQSIEAEQAVLGGLLLDNSTWDAIADRLRAEDFYRRDHQQIFSAIAELSARSEPSDAVTLAEHLAAHPGELDLQARIGAEQAMLQNEHTKLMVLYQAAQAEEVARRQRASELAIANIGSLRRLPAIGLNE